MFVSLEDFHEAQQSGEIPPDCCACFWDGVFIPKPISQCFVVNFIMPDIDPRDVELFFGPLGIDLPYIHPYQNEDNFAFIQPGWTMGHIAAHKGMFPSAGQAKKNGWNKPIPLGFEEFKMGKNSKYGIVYTYIQLKSWEENMDESDLFS